MSETIGFIGVGSQGGPMAHRICDAGMPLVVWARRPEAVAEYAAKGVTTAGTLAELGEMCDHVSICVVNDADVLSVADQLIPRMKAGSRIAVHSTVSPETVARLELQCDGRGISLIDAPVSGGAPAAQAGTLTVMCGARQSAFDAALPVFKTFGRLIVLLGGVGAGQSAKLVNNALFYANMSMAMAALSASEGFNIERNAFAEIVRESSGRSFGFDVFASLAMPAAFTVGAPMLLKDMNLLAEALPGNVGANDLAQAISRFVQALNPDA